MKVELDIHDNFEIEVWHEDADHDVISIQSRFQEVQLHFWNDKQRLSDFVIKFLNEYYALAEKDIQERMGKVDTETPQDNQPPEKADRIDE